MPFDNHHPDSFRRCFKNKITAENKNFLDQVEKRNIKRLAELRHLLWRIAQQSAEHGLLESSELEPFLTSSKCIITQCI